MSIRLSSPDEGDDSDREERPQSTQSQKKNRPIRPGMLKTKLTIFNPNQEKAQGAQDSQQQIQEDEEKQNEQQKNKVAKKRERLEMIQKIGLVDIENPEHQMLVIQILKENNRTFKELAFLQKLIAYLPFFQRNQELMKQNNAIYRLYSEFNYQFYKKNDIIFNYGDFGYIYYIVLRGAVNLYIPKLQKDDSRERTTSIAQKLVTESNERPQSHSKRKIEAERIGSSNKIPSQTQIPPSQKHSQFQSEQDEKQGMKQMKSSRNIVKQSRDGESPSTPSRFSFHDDLSNQNDEATNALNKIVTEMNMVKTFIAGEAFGEIALITKQRRTGTMVCKEDTHLMTLSKLGFDKMLGAYHNQIKTERVGFLKTYGFFQNFPNSNLLSLLLDIKMQVLPFKTVLFTYQQPVEQIFFLKSGQVSISRKCYEEDEGDLALKSQPNDQFQKIEALNSTSKKNKIRKQTKQYTLGIQEANSHFGLEDLLDKNFNLKKQEVHSMLAEVVSETAEIYILNKSIFMNNVGLFGGTDSLINDIKQKLKYYQLRENEMKSTIKQQSLQMNELISLIKSKEFNLYSQSYANEFKQQQPKDICDLSQSISSPKRNQQTQNKKNNSSKNRNQSSDYLQNSVPDSSRIELGAPSVQNYQNSLQESQFLTTEINSSTLKLNQDEIHKSIQLPKIYNSSQQNRLAADKFSLFQNSQRSRDPPNSERREGIKGYKSHILNQFNVNPSDKAETQNMSTQETVEQTPSNSNGNAKLGQKDYSFFKQRKNMYDQMKQELSEVKTSTFKTRKQSIETNEIDVNLFKVRNNSIHNISSKQPASSVNQYIKGTYTSRNLKQSSDLVLRLPRYNSINNIVQTTTRENFSIRNIEDYLYQIQQKQKQQLNSGLIQHQEAETDSIYKADTNQILTKQQKQKIMESIELLEKQANQGNYNITQINNIEELQHYDISKQKDNESINTIQKQEEITDSKSRNQRCSHGHQNCHNHTHSQEKNGEIKIPSNLHIPQNLYSLLQSRHSCTHKPKSLSINEEPSHKAFNMHVEIAKRSNMMMPAGVVKMVPSIQSRIVLERPDNIKLPKHVILLYPSK